MDTNNLDYKQNMSDDSDESGTDSPFDRTSPRDKVASEEGTGSDDELDKLTTRTLRNRISSANSIIGSSSSSSDPLSQSVGERQTGYLALESESHQNQNPLSQSLGEQRSGHQSLEESHRRKNPLSQSMIENRPTGPYCKMKKWYSMDSGESDMESSRKNMPFAGSIKRKLRRKPTKRFDKIEETYGISTEEYEQIRKRVLQERAVVNAIEALQERWRMIMYMYHDCVDLNEGRKDREHRRLTVKRQLELMFIFTMFVIMCIPITVIMVAMCR